MNCVNTIRLFFKLLFTYLILLSSLKGVSQDSLNLIKGTVKDQDGISLNLASVSIISEDSIILDFAITNSEGAFEIPWRKKAGQFPKWLEATFIGYYKQRLSFQPNNNTYNFTLKRDLDVLSEVIVKNKPKLQQFGDTLRYIVSSFAKNEDRSIGDVLRRMPGIIVDADGAIFHNGKRIENLYIHGDDLMSGAYGAATKVVRKEMIESVDVIQHHQPIKVLKDKVFSDRTAINLVLKDENNVKIAVSTKMGLGLPSLYDFTANGILLNKKLKAINTVSTNNVGIDYSNEMKKIGNANLVQNIGTNSSKINLSLASVNTPPIPQEYYYLNKSTLLNLNNLYNFDKGVQIKFNAQGFLDKNSLFYLSNTKNYLGADTIVYKERQELLNRTGTVNGALNIAVNKVQYFLNNTFQYSLIQNQNKGLMSFNEKPFEQLLNNNGSGFSNDFNWVPSFLKKNILEFRWKYTSNKQTVALRILDSLYHNSLGFEGIYDAIHQQMSEPDKQSNAFVSYRRIKNNGTLDLRGGWLFEKQALYSQIYLVNNDSNILYSGDKGNDLLWLKNSFYLRGSYDMKLGKWEGSVIVPLISQTIRYHQDECNLYERHQSLLSNPEIIFRFNFNPEKYLSFRYNYSNDFGNQTQLYRGSILLNYRTLQANDAELKHNKIQSVNIDYNYAKSIKLLFFNAGISYKNAQSNTIISSFVSDNLEKTILLPLPNTQSFFALNSGFSKFLYFIKANTTFNISYSAGRMSQLLNKNLITINTKGWLTSFKINKRFHEYLSVDYNGTGNWSTLSYELREILGDVKQERFSINQSLIFSYIGMKKVLIDFSLKQAYTRQTNNIAVKYFFADSKIRYTPSNRKLDFTVQLNNLFNVKRYIFFTTDMYKLNYSEFKLRGRMISFKLDYFF